METSDISPTAATYIRAGILGFVAGLRSQVPLAALGNAARSGTFAADAEPPLAWFRKGWVQGGLGLLAAGELVGDKLPITPSRLGFPQITGRLGIGAIAGGLVAYEAEASILIGAALGFAGAGAGSVGGYEYRSVLASATPVPDLVWAVVEDGAAIALGAWIAGWRPSR